MPDARRIAADVMDRHFAEPQTEVEWVPEWDESEETQPGDNTRIEDNSLLWERDGFEVGLESYETTHWRAVIQIPDHVGECYPREFDLKCHPLPEHGFVADVDRDGYTTTDATLIIQANMQPVYEVNKFIDDLVESADQSQEFREEIKEKMAVARKNEEQQKRMRPPGWSEENEALVCPHCKETSKRAVERHDGGFNCVHCGESIDDYVEDRSEG